MAHHFHTSEENMTSSADLKRIKLHQDDNENENTEDVYKLTGEDELFPSTHESLTVSQRTMDSLNVRGSQFSRHGDIMNDYLESSDSESETSMLHNDLPGRGAQANHINGETKTWTQNGCMGNNQPLAMPCTSGYRQHHRIISSSCPNTFQSEGTTANHYDSPYSFSDSVYKRHAPNTLGTFDAEVNHNSQWTENCEDDSPQSSPESVTDSQTSMMDSMNVASSQLSGYGTDHMDASGTENLVVSQSETTANTSFMTRSQEVSPKVTSAVSKGTKRRQSQPSVSEDVKELTEDKKKEKLKEKNRQYARESRQKKNKKLLTQEQENKRQEVIIEIYRKMLIIYHKRLCRGTEPTWSEKEMTWYLSSASTHDAPQRVNCMLPNLGEDFFQELGNALYGKIVQDAPTMIKQEKTSPCADQEGQQKKASTEVPQSSLNLTASSRDHEDVCQEVIISKTANSCSGRGPQPQLHTNMVSSSLERSQIKAPATSTRNKIEYWPTELESIGLCTIENSDGVYSQNNFIGVKHEVSADDWNKSTAKMDTSSPFKMMTPPFNFTSREVNSKKPENIPYNAAISTPVLLKYIHNGKTFVICDGKIGTILSSVPVVNNTHPSNPPADHSETLTGSSKLSSSFVGIVPVATIQNTSNFSAPNQGSSKTNGLFPAAAENGSHKVQVLRGARPRTVSLSSVNFSSLRRETEYVSHNEQKDISASQPPPRLSSGPLDENSLDLEDLEPSIGSKE